MEKAETQYKRDSHTIDLLYLGLTQSEVRRGSIFTVDGIEVEMLSLANEKGIYSREKGDETAILFLPTAFFSKAMQALSATQYPELHQSSSLISSELLAPGKIAEIQTAVRLIHRLAWISSQSEEPNILANMLPLAIFKDNPAPGKVKVHFVQHNQWVHKIPKIASGKARSSGKPVSEVAEQMYNIMCTEDGAVSTRVLLPEDRSSSPDVFFITGDDNCFSFVGYQIKNWKSKEVGGTEMLKAQEDFDRVFSAFIEAKNKSGDKRPVHPINIVTACSFSDMKPKTKEQIQKWTHQVLTDEAIPSGPFDEAVRRLKKKGVAILFESM